MYIYRLRGVAAAIYGQNLKYVRLFLMASGIFLPEAETLASVSMFPSVSFIVIVIYQCDTLDRGSAHVSPNLRCSFFSD